ncbi:hypothetical protein Q5752_003158 [Cryptotrichosporon argae]
MQVPSFFSHLRSPLAIITLVPALAFVVSALAAPEPVAPPAQLQDRSLLSDLLGVIGKAGGWASAVWTTEICASVGGTFRGFTYDFGCLCHSDLATFCANNNLDASFQSVITSLITMNGQAHSYPSNSQPTCDGRGSYTCPSLSRRADGTCAASTCADAHILSTSTTCCPRGHSFANSKCCGATGCSHAGATCAAELACKTYASNGVCCPAGTKGWVGQTTACCPAGQVETNGACGCPAGQKFASKSSTTCVDICAAGQTYSDGRCIAPSARARSNRRRLADFSLVELDGDSDASVAAKVDRRCPAGMTACPVPGLSAYECLDMTSDLQSCGGCASVGSGRDCTTIPGARFMGCNHGQCQVYSCRDGWVLANNGTACHRPGRYTTPVDPK